MCSLGDFSHRAAEHALEPDGRKKRARGLTAFRWAVRRSGAGNWRLE